MIWGIAINIAIAYISHLLILDSWINIFHLLRQKLKNL